MKAREAIRKLDQYCSEEVLKDCTSINPPASSRSMFNGILINILEDILTEDQVNELDYRIEFFIGNPK